MIDPGNWMLCVCGVWVFIVIFDYRRLDTLNNKIELSVWIQSVIVTLEFKRKKKPKSNKTL